MLDPFYAVPAQEFQELYPQVLNALFIRSALIPPAFPPTCIVNDNKQGPSKKNCHMPRQFAITPYRGVMQYNEARAVGRTV